MACGNGMWQWRVAMACGNSVWQWRVAMACGNGVWQWRVAMTRGDDNDNGTAWYRKNVMKVWRGIGLLYVSYLICFVP